MKILVFINVGNTPMSEETMAAKLSKICLFHGEIDVLKDVFPLAARSKGIDRHGHAHAKGNEDYENIYNHSAVYN